MRDERTFKWVQYDLRTPNFLAEDAVGKGARGSMFRAHSHDEVVCPNCIHVLLWEAAVCSKSKKYPIRNTAQVVILEAGVL